MQDTYSLKMRGWKNIFHANGKQKKAGVTILTLHLKQLEKEEQKPKTIKKMPIGKYISIITLNVNELNTPTKRYRLIEWIQKQDPYICCLQDMYFRPRDTYRLKIKGWKKIFHANGNQKKAKWQSLFQTK